MSWSFAPSRVCTLFLGLGFFAAACGSSAPTAPIVPPAPTAVSLSINPGDTVFRTGQTQTFSAALTLSDGTITAPAAIAWSSNNNDVLTVSAAGLASATADGTATLSATASGVSTSRSVRVYQDYQGTWRGSFRIRSCTATAGHLAAGYC